MNKLKFLFPLIFIIILSIVLLVGGIIPYFIFYIFILIFILPLIHNLIILKYIQGNIIIPKASLFTDESIPIEYKIENKSYFTIPYIQIKSEIAKEITGDKSESIYLSLKKREIFIKKENLIIKRRGYYEVGKVEVTLKDIFGFYTFKKTISDNISLVVYPKPISISEFSAISGSGLDELLIQNSSFQDKNNISSLRNYREGDSIKSIHWKLTAKKQIPVIKEYETHEDANIFIFMDNSKEVYKKDVDRRLEDKAVDIGLSIVNYCLNQDIKTELVTLEGKRPMLIEGNKSSDLKRFLEIFARFSANGNLDLHSLYLPRIELFNRDSTIVIITPNLDKSMGSFGIQLKMKSLNPLLVVLYDKKYNTGYIELDIADKLRMEGVPVYILDFNSSIREVLEVYNA